MTSDPAGFLPRDFTACKASGASRMGEVEVSADSQVGGGGLSAGEGRGREDEPLGESLFFPPFPLGLERSSIMV